MTCYLILAFSLFTAERRIVHMGRPPDFPFLLTVLWIARVDERHGGLILEKARSSKGINWVNFSGWVVF